MKRMLQGAIAVLFTGGMIGCAVMHSSGEFFLLDSSGRKQGPYEIRHGEGLTIAGNNYTVYVPSVVIATNKVVREMKKIIISEIDFREVNINDAFAFLCDKGLRIIPSQPTLRSESESTEEPPKEIPKITFDARRISLYEALCVVCCVADLEWCVVGSGVMIRPKDRSNKVSDVDE